MYGSLKRGGGGYMKVAVLEFNKSVRKYPKRGKATTPTPILKILPSLSNKYPKRRKITTPTPITFIYYEISKEGKDNNTNTNVTYSDIMQQEQFAVAEISRISDTKTLMEQNLCNLKKAIKSPSSDNLRRIVALTRRIGELEEDRTLHCS
uniref:Uncharacterized protein n=1 Tax=Oryza sativa subsp. japonica TaxID=39947 RepID=Q5N845_ORYSJ|nr:hypothetical protein [Oryza sativa Japonica Group]BAD82362.1 hypothetical protein [Oryza sativa Japonica Group]